MPPTHTATSKSIRPQKREAIRAYEIDGEAVLYDLARDTVHYLNRSAWLIWSLCDGKRGAVEISQEVATRFEMPLNDRIPESEILNDTIITLTNLSADGLIDLPGDDACTCKTDGCD